jgi:mannose-6-phosphate isomerase-like protein (cupin superfamily)
MYYPRVVMTLDKSFQINLADARQRLPGPQGEKSVLLFEHGSMVIKLYTPHGTDEQTPHSQDEIYVVAQGTGEFVCAEARQPFGPHDVLFAAAGVEHRFENFTDDFAVWVVFYGPEGGEVDQS